MHIQFAELPVTDQDRAKDFYIRHLGCTEVSDMPIGADDGWRWLELAFPGSETHLHFHRRDRMHLVEGEPVMVLIDSDVAGTIERLRSEGVEIVSEPGPAPYDPSLTTAEFRDSEGNRMVVSRR
jgi:catechol 2,3-dioxygenase-like lactoylglutathione lyase family enzyme